MNHDIKLGSSFSAAEVRGQSELCEVWAEIQFPQSFTSDLLDLGIGKDQQHFLLL